MGDSRPLTPPATAPYGWHWRRLGSDAKIVGIPLPWQPPDSLRPPPGVSLSQIDPRLVARTVAEYLVPAIFALQGAGGGMLEDQADRLASLRTQLLALGDAR